MQQHHDARAPEPNPETPPEKPASGHGRILRLQRARRRHPRVLPLPPPLAGTPEARPLGRHARLIVALRRLPRSWLDAIAARQGLHARGQRPTLEPLLARRLATVSGMRRAVVRLPLQSRRRLAHLLAVGGWAPQMLYACRFPRDLPFVEWDWADSLPRTPLGRLRAEGLVFLGRAHHQGRECGIIMVPHEVREVLAVTDWEALPYAGDRGGHAVAGSRPGRGIPIAGSGAARPRGETPGEDSAWRESARTARALPPLESTRTGGAPPPRSTPLQLEPARSGITLSGLLEAAREATRRERPAQAAHILTRAADLDPLAAEPLVHLGLLALANHTFGKARRLLEKGRRLAVLHNARGDEKRLRGEEAPVLLRAYHGLAQVALADGRLHEAVILLARLLELDPTDPLEARFFLPETLHRMDAIDRAEAAYRHLVEGPRDGSRPDPWFGLGLALAARGLLEDAVLMWRGGCLRNLYVTPALLGRPLSRHRIHHASDLETPEWARSYAGRVTALWAAQPEATALLSRLWSAPAARTERLRARELGAEALASKNGERRDALIDLRQQQARLAHLQATQPRILGELGLSVP